MRVVLETRARQEERLVEALEGSGNGTSLQRRHETTRKVSSEGLRGMRVPSDYKTHRYLRPKTSPPQTHVYPVLSLLLLSLNPSASKHEIVAAAESGYTPSQMSLGPDK